MICHFVHAVMCSQKTPYDLFQPSTTKSSQTSSTGQKRKPDEDPQEIFGPKKRVFSSKWLEQVQFIDLFSSSTLV